MFKKIIIALSILLVLLIGAIASTPLWLDLEKVKERIITEAEKATGRDFNIAGELTLEFYPYIGFSAQQVSLSNPTNFTHISENMVTVDRLGIAIEVLPLLTGSLKLDHLLIENPTITLAQTKEGHNNWTFNQPTASSQKAKKPEANTSQEAAAPPTLPAGLVLNDIRLINGALAYHTSSGVQTFDNVHAEINLPALDEIFHLKGKLHYNDKPVQADITLNSLETLMAHDTARIALKASFDNQQINTSGDISISHEQMLAYSLESIEARTPELSLSGRSQGTVQIKSTPLSADVSLHITSAQLNLPHTHGEQTPEKEKKPTENVPTAIENNAKPTKIVWPDEKLGLDGLTAANVKAALTFDTITLDSIAIRDGDVVFELQNGKLLANIKSLKAFDGDIKAVIQASQQGNFGLDLNLAELSVSALNRDLGQELPLAGSVSMAATYKTNGQTVARLIQNLDGTLNVELLGAGLSGTDAKTMLTTYGGPFGMALLETVDSQALSRLNDRVSSVIIKSETFSGIMDLTSVQILTPIAEVIGEGNIHLPNSTINLYMTPRMLTEVTTHSKSLDAVVANLRTPFYVRGHLLSPKVQLDQEALGKNLMRESIKSGLDKAIRDLDEDDNPLVRDGLNVLRGFFGEEKAK